MFVSVGVRLVGGYMAVTCFVRSRGAKENGEGEAGERGGGVGWGGCAGVSGFRLVFVGSSDLVLFCPDCCTIGAAVCGVGVQRRT